MTTYLQYNVNLSNGQKANLAKAIRSGSKITLRLKNHQLHGNDELMLTKTQVNKIKKAITGGTGVEIKISKTQIKKSVKKGGSLFSSLMQLGAKTLPYVTMAASKALPALATGAVSALGLLGVDKIFDNGVQTGGFMIPQNKIDQLIKYKDWLTEAQKRQITSALQSGGQLVIKPTKKQQGRFLGTLLASIGVPLLLNALTGKGLSAPKRVPPPPPPSKGEGLNVSPKPGALVPYQPPPFFGSWNGSWKGGGKKGGAKKKGHALLLGKNSPFNSIPILGTPL